MRMLKPLKLSKHEIILLSGVFSLLALALASCKDDKDETPAAKITVNEQVLAFDCEESAQNFTFESTLKWTIECGAADWLTVSPLEGKGGTVTVSVAVAANPSATPRSASFFIRSMAEQVEITVNQADDEGAHLLTFAEDFKAYLVENFDTDGDGEISRDEAELITAIECEDLGLTSLEGVRNLTNLQTLHCSYNAIETLDVSGMTSLTELLCDHNLITDLNVSGCTSLSSIECNSNAIGELNLADCRNTLTTITCNENKLARLDLTNFDKLFHLNCDDNQLTELLVDGCTALTSVDCASNQLTTLDFRQTPLIGEVYCSNNQLTSVLFPENSMMGTFECGGNQFTTIDLRNCPHLASLTLAMNKLTSLSVNYLKDLTFIDCTYNSLRSLDLTNLPNMNFVHCDNTGMEVLYLRDDINYGEVSVDEETKIEYRSAGRDFEDVESGWGDTELDPWNN